MTLDPAAGACLLFFELEVLAIRVSTFDGTEADVGFGRSAFRALGHGIPRYNEKHYENILPSPISLLQNSKIFPVLPRAYWRELLERLLLQPRVEPPAMARSNLGGVD